MCTTNEITSLLHNSSYLINIEGKDNMSGSLNEMLEIVEFNTDDVTATSFSSLEETQILS